MTPEFKMIISKRQKAYHKETTVQYHHFRNLANRLCAKIRSTHHQKMMDHLKSNPNPKKWWQCVKQLAGYPKKQVLPNLVPDGKTLYGKE